MIILKIRSRNIYIYIYIQYINCKKVWFIQREIGLYVHGLIQSRCPDDELQDKQANR